MFNYSADVRGAEGDFVTGNNKVVKYQRTKRAVAFSMVVNTPEQTEKTDIIISKAM
jgi:hypothetical protein